MKQEYRIVKKYCGFLSHWYYTLEAKFTGKWLWLFPYETWEQVAGNSNETRIPDTWKDFNVTETIIEDKLKPR